MEDFRVCRNYINNIDDHPELVGEECKQREGIYYPADYDKHFKKFSGTKTCKHCFYQRRRAGDGDYDPVILPNHPKDDNGRPLNYWHLIDKNIILKVDDT